MFRIEPRLEGSVPRQRRVGHFDHQPDVLGLRVALQVPLAGSLGDDHIRLGGAEVAEHDGRVLAQASRWRGGGETFAQDGGDRCVPRRLGAHRNDLALEELDAVMWAEQTVGDGAKELLDAERFPAGRVLGRRFVDSVGHEMILHRQSHTSGERRTDSGKTVAEMTRVARTLLLTIATLMGVPWCWAQDVVWQLTAPASIVQLEAARYSERAFYTYSTGSNTFATQVVNTTAGALVGPPLNGRGLAISHDGAMVGLGVTVGSENQTQVRAVDTGTLIGSTTFVDFGTTQFGHDSSHLFAVSPSNTLNKLALPSLAIVRQWPYDSNGRYVVNPDEPFLFQRTQLGAWFELSTESNAVRAILPHSAQSTIIGQHGRIVAALFFSPRILAFQIAGTAPFAMHQAQTGAIQMWSDNANGIVATTTESEVSVWRISDATELLRFGVPSAQFALTSNDFILVSNGQTLTAHRLGSGLAANATLSGTLRQTGLAQPAGVPLTIELASSQPAGTEVHRVTADPEGRFRVRTSLTGTLRARFKTPTGLSTVFDALSIPADVGNLTLHTGDVDGNNSVALADFVAMRNAFGSKEGTASYLEGADLNRDGTVNTMDFLLLRNHYGRSGQ